MPGIQNAASYGYNKSSELVQFLHAEAKGYLNNSKDSSYELGWLGTHLDEVQSESGVSPCLITAFLGR